MSIERKTRPDAVLRNLPEARQDSIGSMMLPGPQNKSLAEAQSSLAADGIKVSQQALSRWFSWWCVKKQREANEQFTEDWLEQLKTEHPELSAQQLFSLGQALFSRMAIQTQNPEEWARINLVRQRQEKLALSEKQIALEDRRIALLERKAAQADAANTVLSEPLSAEEKEAKLKQIFGIG